ncbi:MAG: type II toxin-antitoxin system RelE/ParE family toxin [Chloroflexota bacterium]|nr:type II toxin-antitoxin system RelE/ParE family toxin [Chloroflexota bacterium]
MTSNIDLVISFSARQDIYDVLQYTVEIWGDEQADIYERMLDAAFQRLRSFPEIGHVRDDGVREFAIRHHVILYRHEAETVTIVRVVHPRRLRD